MSVLSTIALLAENAALLLVQPPKHIRKPSVARVKATMELVYYIFCLLLSTSSGLNSSSKPETKCHSNLERILESNSPEVLAISVGNDLNTFTSSQVRLR